MNIVSALIHAIAGNGDEMADGDERLSVDGGAFVVRGTPKPTDDYVTRVNKRMGLRTHSVDGIDQIKRSWDE
jgi:hypothetical protein